MIPKLAGPRSDGRGRSFKSLFDYIFHDKGRASSSRRVAWAEAINCAISGNIRRAWYEMMLTWENRTALKRAYGLADTGRSNERPVLHLTLSWHPRETPDRSEMMAAAQDVLDWLDLADHQAVVVAHTDEPHPHVHLAINIVHPLTGKTASLYQCKKALSAWARHWEEAHGGIIVESRARHEARSDKDVPQNVREPLPLVSESPAATAGNDNDPMSSARRPSFLRLVTPAINLRSRFRRAASLLAAVTPLLLLFSSRPSPTGPPIARPPNATAPPVERKAAPRSAPRPRYRI
jgi:hypothetical protein